MTAAARDPVLRALGGLATGAAAGAAIITAGLLVLRTAQRGDAPQPQDTGFLILSVAALLGMIAAAATGWLLHRRRRKASESKCQATGTSVCHRREPSKRD